MSRLRRLLEATARAAIARCRGDRLIAAAVRRRGRVLVVRPVASGRALRVTLPARGETVLLAVGKAAREQAGAVARLLGRRLSRGLVIAPATTRAGRLDPRLRLIRSSHPVPDRRALGAARAALALARSLGPADLLIVVVSGGASALLTEPAPGLSLADEAAVTRALLASGIDIVGINTVRKHLSAVKGGRLAAATRARVLTLVTSDVLGGGADAVGSGPTVADPTTYAEARALLGRARGPGLRRARELLARGARGELDETPKPADPRARRWRAVLVAGPRTLLEVAQREARRRGLHVVRAELGRPGESVEGVAAQLGLAMATLRTRALRSQRRELLLSVREPTVTLGRRNGKGGRASHLALLVARELAARPGFAFAAVASDGVDGNTAAAGAAIDGASWTRASHLALEPATALGRHDAGTVWAKAGLAVVTGASGTNLLNLVLLATEAARPRR